MWMRISGLSCDMGCVAVTDFDWAVARPLLEKTIDVMGALCVQY